MSHAIAFDTFYYAKELKKVGFTEAQVDTQVNFAKKQTDAINDFIDNSIATKQDLKELELKIDLKMETSKNELKAEIARMTYRLGGMIVGAVAVLGFLVQLHH